LLGDESQIALQQARQQGLLGLAAGLLQAGGPSRQRTNIGQAIGAGLQAGQQAYRGALSEQIQGQQMAMKLAEQQRLLQQQRALQQAMPTLITQGQPTVFGQQFPVMRDEEGNLMPGVQAGAPQINQQALSQISALLPPKDFKDFMSALQTRVELTQGPKPEIREAGGGLYSVVGGQATQLVAAPPRLQAVGDTLYEVVNGKATPVVSQTGKLTGEYGNQAKLLFGTDVVSALPPNATEQINAALLARAEATSPKVSVTTTEAADKALVGQIAKQLPEQRQQAMDAARVNTMLDDILKLNKEKTFVGMLAPGSIGASQFLTSLGVNVAPSMLANTREFQAATNLLVLDFMGAMGGAKGFSKEESAILYDAFPKIIDDAQSRARIVQMLKRRNDRLIADYNENLNSWNQFQRTGRLEFSPIQSGVAIPQDLRDAARQALGGK
jgi:hypothetical protein